MLCSTPRVRAVPVRGIQRSEPQRERLVRGIGTAGGEEQETSAIGQKSGHPVVGFAIAERRHRRSRTPTGSHSLDWTVRDAKKDRVVVPHAVSAGRVGDNERRPSVDLNLVQFSACEETDPSAVRRPEWTRPAIRTGQLLR